MNWGWVMVKVRVMVWIRLCQRMEVTVWFCSDAKPSSSSCRPLLVSDCQLWPAQELYWLFHAGPSYTPHPGGGDCNTHTHTRHRVRLLLTALSSWAECGCSVPVAERRDEVEAAVDSVVLDVPSVQAALIPEVLLELQVDVVFYLFPADGDTNITLQISKAHKKELFAMWAVSK